MKARNDLFPLFVCSFFCLCLFFLTLLGLCWDLLKWCQWPFCSVDRVPQMKETLSSQEADQCFAKSPNLGISTGIFWFPQWLAAGLQAHSCPSLMSISHVNHRLTACCTATRRVRSQIVSKPEGCQVGHCPQPKTGEYKLSSQTRALSLLEIEPLYMSFSEESSERFWPKSLLRVELYQWFTNF